LFAASAAVYQSRITRGSLLIWICDAVLNRWHSNGDLQQRGAIIYSDLALEICLNEICLKLRLVYKLALQQTQGFVASLLHLMGLDALPVPNYSRSPGGKQASRLISAPRRRPQSSLQSTDDEAKGSGNNAQSCGKPVNKIIPC